MSALEMLFLNVERQKGSLVWKAYILPGSLGKGFKLSHFRSEQTFHQGNLGGGPLWGVHYTSQCLALLLEYWTLHSPWSRTLTWGAHSYGNTPTEKENKSNLPQTLF